MDFVYIARNKSIKTRVSLYTKVKRAEETAVLDSGATECFIHPQLIKKHRLQKVQLPKSRTVKNVDGTTNRMGKITHMVEMMIQHEDQINQHVFLVADIGEDDVILGYTFFESTNPQINWSKGFFQGSVILSDWNNWLQNPQKKREMRHGPTP